MATVPLDFSFARGGLGVLPTKPTITLLCVCLASYVLLSLLFRKRQRLAPGVPIVGLEGGTSLAAARKRFVHDSKSMLVEGYMKYNGGFYYVPSPLGERLMIPTKYLEELRNAPIDKLDFVATFQEMFEGKYTTMGSRSTLHPRVVKAQLNQHLGDVMPAVEEEINDSFALLFPPCEDWTAVPAADVFTKLVARVSSRMFGGTTLSRHDEWVKASIDFAIDGFIGAQKIKKFPTFLRPIAQHFIAEIRKIHGHYALARRVLIPLLKEREAEGSKPMDLLQWMSENAQGEEKDKQFIADIQLKVSFAAIHTSAAAPTQLLYDLCQYPEYIQPLREELEAALAEEGTLTKQAFVKMPKLDSFLKESQRFNPLLLITFERVVTEDYTLSDGFVIPGHTTIGVPTQAITMDPNLYPDPEKFDGFRFYKLRETDPKNTGRLQYASSNPASMSFGYGRHACPGRFFAANEIKAIMAHVLLNYDFHFHDGQSRPESILVETQYLPNHSATIMMKRRNNA